MSPIDRALFIDLASCLWCLAQTPVFFLDFIL